jgi:hypothetical protein
MHDSPHSVYDILVHLLSLVTDNVTSTAPPPEGAPALSASTTVPPQFTPASAMKWSVQALASTLPLTTTVPTIIPTTVTYTVAPDVVTTPVTHHIVPWMPSVHHHHQGPRWGPYFEEGAEPQNVTARVGSTVRLDCKIGMLHDKTVSI